eukprot:3136587-Rhodomonas_salina.1
MPQYPPGTGVRSMPGLSDTLRADRVRNADKKVPLRPLAETVNRPPLDANASLLSSPVITV